MPVPGNFLGFGTIGIHERSPGQLTKTEL
jgi:hypothetical protein